MTEDVWSNQLLLWFFSRPFVRSITETTPCTCYAPVLWHLMTINLLLYCSCHQFPEHCANSSFSSFWCWFGWRKQWRETSWVLTLQLLGLKRCLGCKWYKEAKCRVQVGLVGSFRGWSGSLRGFGENTQKWRSLKTILENDWKQDFWGQDCDVLFRLLRV